MHLSAGEPSSEDAGLLASLAQLGLEIHDSKRNCPFLAVTVDDDDLPKFVGEHAAELGRLLPGGIEHEEDDYLRQRIMNENLSRRAYERLYITWTDALAVYSTRGIDRETADRTLFRALQLYETCVIGSRLFDTLQFQIDETYASLRAWWPRPWRVNALPESVGRIRRDLVTAPPVQSVEAARLLDAAYAAFELTKAADRAAARAGLLETRFQWSKTQFLGGIAIILFILERLQIFNLIAHRLHLASP